ncbi:RING-CH-type domain-containing protein [Caenorhabditis elegans]|uniref:RING-CH-type domain-containing protein n=1 Tax=Caenorhabditis elegans TaxID=6239 RepID=Q9N5V7_CAEEL|nr:RING-CH-type domain-containing protein [Caenorhabditis elegans]CCD67933.2 RING-CH-type domain-containing protein [Caenorhabditis elegans]|eukprot:NP_001348646.1 MARCH (Membrane-Associated Ring finger (C3HC4)) homolog [Caenorhabditis elegans]
MAQDGDRHHIFVSAPPPPPPSSSIPAPSQPNRLEKEPLIDEETDMIDESRATYWKGCEFLKASGLYSSKLSLQSASANMCRICHTSTSTRSNPLISPCRCSGTLLFVHKACVVRWLEMSTRKMVPSPRCELCGYDYRRGNIFQMKSLHVPHVDRSSCLLNVLFLITVLIMIFCGYFTIQFIQENALLKRRLFAHSSTNTAYTWKRRGYFSGNGNGDGDGSSDGYFSRTPVSSLFDIKVVLCASMFLVSFILALFTQYKAESTIFRCIFRFFVINKNWMIKNYDIKNDPEMAHRRGLQKSSPVPLTLSASDMCIHVSS